MNAFKPAVCQGHSIQASPGQSGRSHIGPMQVDLAQIGAVEPLAMPIAPSSTRTKSEVCGL